ncbi:opioid growth factor receptor-like protein 1 [Dreissena polymorpha]|uniref:opioid growth factor receptor-like protein 1 n=1 Tax=Dreissena polymorpha TaxID=45954 RepID=UPI002263F5AF|nr:opioid growth factor receptor-like protein 1 [Dreissena polymorpha]
MSLEKEQNEHVQSHNTRHQTHWFVNSGHGRETGVAEAHSYDTEEEMETEDLNTARNKQPSPSFSAIEITNITEIEFYSDNLKFYRNQICTRPFPGQEIEGVLAWTGDYTRLEEEHSYIQWLFPTPQTSGHNFSAQQLYPHEAETIRNDDVMNARVLRAYKMMLDFFGMELVDERSGMIRRCAANWKERYAHLNTSFHNCMRITRILISIGQLGYARFQVPLVRFLMTEAIVTKELHNLNSNSMDYWIEAVVDGDEMFDLMQLRQFMQQNRKQLEKLLGIIFQTA